MVDAGDKEFAPVVTPSGILASVAMFHPPCKLLSLRAKRQLAQTAM
jgi:hypothetical protein